jgi:hypothetical protein
MSSMSVRTQIERLSDWYDLNRPHVRVIRVNVKRETLLFWLDPFNLSHTNPPRPLMYRGRRILCKGERE